MANAYFGPKSMKNGILILIDQKNSLAYFINAKKSMKDDKLENTEVCVQHKTVLKCFCHFLYDFVDT